MNKLTKVKSIHSENNINNKQLLDKLKFLVRVGRIFSPKEFYNDYEGCLKGDGSATFVNKNLEIIEDFKKGWELLEEAVDEYDCFSYYKCKIAFVVWFNR